MPPPPHPHRLAAALPDTPRWLEARAILLSGDCLLFGDPAGEGYVVRNRTPPLVCAINRPSVQAVREAVELDDRPVDVLAPPEAGALISAALPGWSAVQARLHLRPRDAPFPLATDVEVRVHPPWTPLVLEGLPQGLQQELSRAASHSPVVTVWADGRPVSFAYVPWRTEGLYDVSVDTLEGHRGRGLARAAAARLMAEMASTGLRPVWGALETNLPSLRLAARLDFVELDRLLVFSPPSRD